MLSLKFCWLHKKELIYKMSEKQDIENSNWGTLYLVNTPIGNKEDISLRALRVLKKCEMVICEEPKEGKHFMHIHSLNKQVDFLNEQNETEKTQEIIAMLKKGMDIALISDCGSPAIADPGAMLVQAAIRLKFPMVYVPGVTSIMTALVYSGFDTSQFLYAGFLHREKQVRLQQLRNLSTEGRTVILLETPYRLLPVLEAAASIMPKRDAYIGCNLTLPYETHHFGTFSQLFSKFSKERFKGEFVIVFRGEVFRIDDKHNISDKKDINLTKKDSARHPKKIIYSEGSRYSKQARFFGRRRDK